LTHFLNLPKSVLSLQATETPRHGHTCIVSEVESELSSSLCTLRRNQGVQYALYRFAKVFDRFLAILVILENFRNHAICVT
jgi:hypothetical protein